MRVYFETLLNSTKLSLYKITLDFAKEGIIYKCLKFR